MVALSIILPKTREVLPGVAGNHNKQFWWNIQLLHPNIFLAFDSDAHALLVLGKSNGNSTYHVNRQCG